MKPSYKWLVVAVAICLVGVEARLASLKTSDTATARLEATRLATKLARLRADEADSVAKLKAANDDLSAVKADLDEGAGDQEGALRDWSKRVNRLKDLFASRTDQAIPELTLLTNSDWLRIGRAALLDTDDGIRRALADARSTAKFNLSLPMSQALRAYKRDHAGALPGSTTDLQTYFNPPIDPSILLRYRMALTGSVDSALKDTYALTEQSPVDEENDIRWEFLAGNGSRVATWALSELNVVQDDARVAYATANEGKASPGLVELLPYIKSAEMRDVTKAMADFMGSHGGRQTTDTADLMPYLNNDEARALAQRIWPKRN